MSKRSKSSKQYSTGSKKNKWSGPATINEYKALYGSNYGRRNRSVGYRPSRVYNATPNLLSRVAALEGDVEDYWDQESNGGNPLQIGSGSLIFSSPMIGTLPISAQPPAGRDYGFRSGEKVRVKKLAIKYQYESDVESSSILGDIHNVIPDCYIAIIHIKNNNKLNLTADTILGNVYDRSLVGFNYALAHRNKKHTPEYTILKTIKLPRGDLNVSAHSQSTTGTTDLIHVTSSVQLKSGAIYYDVPKKYQLMSISNNGDTACAISDVEAGNIFVLAYSDGYQRSELHTAHQVIKNPNPYVLMSMRTTYSQ